MLLIKYVVGPSAVHGLGVFSYAFVPEGTKVWIFHPIIDRIISENELKKLPLDIVKKIHNHAEFIPDRQLFRLPADGDYFMNHSDDPNLDDRGDEMLANRDIRAGEELFCDYRITKVLAFDPDAALNRMPKREARRP